MDKISVELNNLSLNELVELQTKINEKVKSYKFDAEKQEIVDEVNISGYYCGPEVFDIQDINVITVPFYLEVRAYDKDNKSDATVMRVHDKQEEWVKLLDFDYEPSDDDKWEDIDEWSYGDHDDPAIGRGKMDMYVYFKNQTCPENGTKFKTVEDDGTIETWTVKNDEVYNGEDKFCARDEWNDYSLFIVK